jgi:hypothetical protein
MRIATNEAKNHHFIFLTLAIGLDTETLSRVVAVQRCWQPRPYPWSCCMLSEKIADRYRVMLAFDRQTPRHGEMLHWYRNIVGSGIRSTN